jgi:hypothetical protein
MLNRVIRVSVIALLEEERNDASPAAHDISVANHGKLDVGAAFEVVGRNEQLIRTELGGPVQIDRRRRFVGAERHDLLDPLVQRRLNHILGAQDVGLDRLERIVLGRRHLFQGRGVDHQIDSLHGAAEPVPIAHVADEVPHLGVLFQRIHLLHFELLELVAGIDNYPPHVRVLLKQDLHHLLSEGAGPARDQD